MAEIRAQVKGLPDLREALRSIPFKLRRKVLGQALRAAAKPVQVEARKRTPVLSAAGALRNPFRKPGTVRRAISVRTSKIARRAGDVGVFVNVKPAKQGARGAKSKNDPYYWRWLQWGTMKMRAYRFLDAGAAKLPESLRIFIAKVGPQIAKMNQGKGAPL